MAERLNKASIAFRVAPFSWNGGMDEAVEHMRKLLAFFAGYPGVTDQITIFAGITHGPVPLAEMERRIPILRAWMDMAREAGYGTGINVLSTIGHQQEDLKHVCRDDFTCLTDIHGHVCPSAWCPNDPGVREYVESLYRLIVKAGPDYIYVDDDMRLYGHMPLAHTCFCDRCMQQFAVRCGKAYTREELLAAFNGPDTPETLALRQLWVNKNRDMLGELLAHIERTVHAEAPHIVLGFMSVDGFYEGHNFDGWGKIMSGPDGMPVMARPGGGFYNEDVSVELLDKAHSIGRQVALLPENVVCIQSEIENFPYEVMKKSPFFTAMEAAADLAAGCTGAAFNVLGLMGEPRWDEYHGMMRKILQLRPFYDRMAQSFGRGPALGIYTGWSKDSHVVHHAGGDWFQGSVQPILANATREMLELGLPAAYHPEAACVTLLVGDMVRALKPEDVERILSRGVYMDAAALAHLNGMGYGDLTGFAVDRSYRDDCIEIYADHPFHEGFSGMNRNPRQALNPQMAYGFKSTQPGTQILCRLVDFSGDEQAACGMGIFENRLGGKVCVAGYFPWQFVQSLNKVAQLRRLMRWLSHDEMPAMIASHHRVGLWVRQNGDARSYALINASMEPSEGLTIAIKTDRSQMTVCDTLCRCHAVKSHRNDGTYAWFSLPTLQAWEMLLLV